MSLPPIEIPLGAMRFNSDSQKLEYWNGSVWMQIHTFSPNLDGGARVICAGGIDSPATKDVIDFATASSAGNFIDFGDLTAADYFYTATGNSIRALWIGNSTISNSMEFVTIATQGNAVDWGDQSGTAQHSGGNASDSHGGLE